MQGRLEIWVDGASNVHSKKKPGGWAYAIVDEKGAVVRTSWDGASPTTNSRMEMNAPLQALNDILEDIKKGFEWKPKVFQVCTDSALVYRCMVESWYVEWKYYGRLYGAPDVYLNKDGEIIKNQDLWKALIKAVNLLHEKGYEVTWRKVRGHRGVIHNELVDRMAKKGKMKYS